MDACGSPECRFLSGAKRAAKTPPEQPQALLSPAQVVRRALPGLVVCLALAINKMAVHGKRRLAYQGWW